MHCPFSEKYLQIIWNEQMLSSRLRCMDGRSLQIIFPGLWHRGAGPDFTDAALLVDGVPLRGSIEIHRSASDWYTHGHHQDPRYSDVILHAVWSADDAERTPPLATLLLEPHLQQDWKLVLKKVNAACYPRAMEIPPGACFMRWALTDDNAVQEILKASGWSRFRRRGRDILAHCAVRGSDQALYELTFEGLGYSANRAAFRKFAEETPLEMLTACDRGDLDSILFGRGGLLPDCTTGQRLCPEMRAVAEDAWHCCWRNGISPLQIKWNHGGARPLNSVHSRMAAGASWLSKCSLQPAAWLQTMLDVSRNGRELLRHLLKCSAADADMPWSSRRDFYISLPVPAALLGRERLCDLALNIWLPYLGAKAELTGDNLQLSVIRDAWQRVPRTQENHLLKEAVHRFLSPPSRSKQLLTHAAQQQGMMDIYRNFCLALQHSCNDCPFVAGV